MWFHVLSTFYNSSTLQMLNKKRWQSFVQTQSTSILSRDNFLRDRSSRVFNHFCRFVYIYMDIYTYVDIHIYGYIQATYGMYIYYDDAVMWCPAGSSTSFEDFYNQASGVDFFLSAVIEILTKECPLCKKQSVPCTLYHCIAALCRAGNLDRGLFKPELSRLLQLYNKTGLSSMDFVPFKINFAFRKHLTLLKRLS